MNKVIKLCPFITVKTNVKCPKRPLPSMVSASSFESNSLRLLVETENWIYISDYKLYIFCSSLLFLTGMTWHFLDFPSSLAINLTRRMNMRDIWSSIRTWGEDELSSKTFQNLQLMIGRVLWRLLKLHSLWRRKLTRY